MLRMAICFMKFTNSNANLYQEHFYRHIQNNGYSMSHSSFLTKLTLIGVYNIPFDNLHLGLSKKYDGDLRDCSAMKRTRFNSRGPKFRS